MRASSGDARNRKIMSINAACKWAQTRMRTSAGEASSIKDSTCVTWREPRACAQACCCRKWLVKCRGRKTLTRTHVRAKQLDSMLTLWDGSHRDLQSRCASTRWISTSGVGTLLQKVDVGMSGARDIDAHACTHEVARPHVAIMRRLP